ncbi:MAG TPA: ABC transporter permease [Bryobacteraceae bacterium]|jgi:predicted permease|nr:ABC transporter permease [Bryobacteraceae bacterium]
MLSDLRFALRTFLKSPGFTAVAILALALGIGANAALFSVINAVLLKPLPYPDSARLVRIFETFLPGGYGTVSTPNFLDWHRQNHVFDHLEAFGNGSLNLQSNGEPERIPSVVATAGLFEMLGAKPMLGRTFLPDEDQPGKPHVVVVSERLWRRRFGADPKLLGSQITLDGQSTTVIGIMPASFQFPPGSLTRTLWMPLVFSPDQLKERGSHWMSVIGRLKSGITLPGADAEMKQIAARLAQQFPDEQKGRSIWMRTVQDVLVGDLRPALLVLMGSVGFVLLIACANVANLLLARAASRTREVAVRAALGASRARLIRQFLTESILLALAGGAVGAFLADEGVKALVALASDQIPLSSNIHLDATVFLFLLAVCLVAGVIFGLVPAFQSTGRDLQEGLREGGRSGGAGMRSAGLRNALVISEFALALVLLIGAGLLMRTFLALNATDPGLVTRGVLTMSVSVPEEKYPKGAMWQRFYQPALERIQGLPGIRAAGIISLLPLQSWGWNGEFSIAGRPPEEPGHQPFAEFRQISPGYFHAMGIRILKGRDAGREDSANAPPVALINDALAKRYFAGQDPVGQKINWDGWKTIVGVAANTRQSGLGEEPLPEIYCPAAQLDSISGMTFVISTNVDPSSVAHAVTAAIQSVDPSQPVFGVKTMTQVVSDSLSNQRLYAWLLGVFAVLALTLASAGIYGVMSYLVTQRTQEFGVRMALGASTNNVLGMVLRQALLLIGAGLAIGLGGALAVTRVLTNFLFSVKPVDPVTFAGVSLLLTAVALLATYLPALRATRVDPMVALRYE